MPWSNQGGGPWGSGGSKGPWGPGPQSSGPTPPDLEELLRRSQDKLGCGLPGGSFGSRGFALIALVVLVLWGFSGFFRVEPDELGVVLRFGKYVRDAQPGLNYHLPYPIESALTPKALRVNKIDVGMRLVEDMRRGSTMREVPEARGRVAQITQAAEAYREQTVAEATGQAARFLKIYEQYKNAPDVTRQRMYLETMERLFGGTDKIIVDTNKSGGGSGVVPYLPLEKLRPPTERHD